MAKNPIYYENKNEALQMKVRQTKQVLLWKLKQGIQIQVDQVYYEKPKRDFTNQNEST